MRQQRTRSPNNSRSPERPRNRSRSRSRSPPRFPDRLPDRSRYPPRPTNRHSPTWFQERYNERFQDRQGFAGPPIQPLVRQQYPASYRPARPHSPDPQRRPSPRLPAPPSTASSTSSVSNRDAPSEAALALSRQRHDARHAAATDAASTSTAEALVAAPSAHMPRALASSSSSPSSLLALDRIQNAHDQSDPVTIETIERLMLEFANYNYAASRLLVAKEKIAQRIAQRSRFAALAKPSNAALADIDRSIAALSTHHDRIRSDLSAKYSGLRSMLVGSIGAVRSSARSVVDSRFEQLQANMPPPTISAAQLAKATESIRKEIKSVVPDAIQSALPSFFDTIRNQVLESVRDKVLESVRGHILQSVRKDLLEELSNSTKFIQSIQNQIRETKESIAAQIQSAVNSLKSRIDSAIADSSARADALESRISQIESAHQDLSVSITQATSVLTSVSDRFSGSADHVRLVTERIPSLSSSVEQHDTKLASIESSIQHIYDSIDDIRSMPSTVLKPLLVLSDHIEATKNSVASLAQRVSPSGAGHASYSMQNVSANVEKDAMNVDKQLLSGSKSDYAPVSVGDSSGLNGTHLHGAQSTESVGLVDTVSQWQQFSNQWLHRIDQTRADILDQLQSLPDAVSESLRDMMPLSMRLQSGGVNNSPSSSGNTTLSSSQQATPVAVPLAASMKGSSVSTMTSMSPSSTSSLPILPSLPSPAVPSSPSASAPIQPRDKLDVIRQRLQQRIQQQMQQSQQIYRASHDDASQSRPSNSSYKDMLQQTKQLHLSQQQVYLQLQNVQQQRQQLLLHQQQKQLSEQQLKLLNHKLNQLQAQDHDLQQKITQTHQSWNLLYEQIRKNMWCIDQCTNEDKERVWEIYSELDLMRKEREVVVAGLSLNGSVSSSGSGSGVQGSSAHHDISASIQNAQSSQSVDLDSQTKNGVSQASNPSIVAVAGIAATTSQPSSTSSSEKTSRSSTPASLPSQAVLNLPPIINLQRPKQPFATYLHRNRDTTSHRHANNATENQRPLLMRKVNKIDGAARTEIVPPASVGVGSSTASPSATSNASNESRSHTTQSTGTPKMSTLKTLSSSRVAAAASLLAAATATANAAAAVASKSTTSASTSALLNVPNAVGADNASTTEPPSPVISATRKRQRMNTISDDDM